MIAAAGGAGGGIGDEDEDEDLRQSSMEEVGNGSYDEHGGMGAAAEETVEIEQMSSRYFLNSWRWEVRKTFIGSIHASFVPNEDMFARP